MVKRKSNQNVIIGGVSNKIVPKVEKYDYVFLIIFLSYFFVPQEFVRIVLLISLLPLTVLYFLKAFSLETLENEVPNIIRLSHRLVNFSSSILLVGFLLALQNYPGYALQLTVGILGLVISSILILIFRDEEGDLNIFDSRLFIRIGLLLTFALVLKFTNLFDSYILVQNI